MEYTTKVTGEVKDLKDLIRGGLMKPGDEITTGGCMWRVLDVQEDRVLIWKHTGVEDHVFNDNNSNVYEGSDIQKYLQAEFRETVPEELLSLVDDKGFFLLTLEQIRKYLPKEIDRIAEDPDGYTTWWWTSTPYVGTGNSVRYILTSGYVDHDLAYYSNGVAPACWLTI
jgi:hypothetical protein